MTSNHDPARRAALFALPSARGNAPHLTREQPEAEGRRLNAGRYETVEQMDAALDARVARRSSTLGATPSEAAAPSGGGFGPLAAFLFLAAGAAITYALLRRDPGGVSDDVDDDEPVAQPLRNPAPERVESVQVRVVETPAPVQSVVVNQPAPTLVEARRKRRARRAARASARGAAPPAAVQQAADATERVP